MPSDAELKHFQEQQSAKRARDNEIEQAKKDRWDATNMYISAQSRIKDYDNDLSILYTYGTAIAGCQHTLLLDIYQLLRLARESVEETSNVNLTDKWEKEIETCITDVETIHGNMGEEINMVNHIIAKSIEGKEDAQATSDQAESEIQRCTSIIGDTYTYDNTTVDGNSHSASGKF